MCSLLQCVAVCCGVLQCNILCCSVLQCEDCPSDKIILGDWYVCVVYYSVLRCVAACCSVMQCVAVCCSVRIVLAIRSSSATAVCV